MKTQRGIYLNLDETEFVYRYFENKNYFDFYFSSEFNLSRFKLKIKDYLNLEESKIKNRFQIDKIDLELFFAIVLYTKIEKRGFKIFDLSNNIEYNKKEDIEFIVKIKE